MVHKQECGCKASTFRTTIVQANAEFLIGKWATSETKEHQHGGGNTKIISASFSDIPRERKGPFSL